ncbi:FxSxx-COOH system tetratricopeptide repeat protein [Streptomyces violaceoruber]|uniref:FxSxx-COOH system tetratricopeptide repeat protein n=1 Tax=Streptomyces violaceoruber TaxID=1935 RepID=UPI00068E610A|nr:FxSxx-COOH system tetratricopeptide repeat protein [Streptomyces violaceoruber]
MPAAVESVFVSYAGPDRAWAEWAAWHLREVGHAVELDVWDWRIGDNFIERMNDAMRRATTVVALFSNNYFDPARWTREEWTSVVARRERIVPVTIEPLTASDIPDILTAVIRKDLHSLDEQAAITALLEAVNGPTGPRTAPSFPGTPAPVHAVPAGGAQVQRPRLPSGAGLPRVWNVRDRNPHFTGREALISRIREGLLGGRQAVVQALHGLGGIGKTQIALEYAHRFASQYDTVWWIDAAQADQILVRYTELAARLGIAKPEAGAEHNARTLLEHLHTQDRWLIILDNADDPHDFEGLIPTGPGHVLITSRNPGWNDRVHSLNLGVFARSDSLAYLSARMPGITPDQAGGLADDLGDLPLALAQAVGVITSGMTLDRYRHLLTEKTAKLMANGGPPGYPAPLAAAVDIATNRLAGDHPDAADLLRLGAFLGPEPIPTAWLEAVRDRLSTIAVDPDDIMWPQTALQPLARYGLARVDHETFQIHRLTQAILRDRSGQADTVRSEDDVATILTTVDPGDPDTPAAWPRWAAYTTHLAARKDTATSRPELRQALVRAARYLIKSGQERTARDLISALHESWTGVLGEDHPHTLDSAHYLGHVISYFGQYGEARRMHEDTLERRRRTLGEDHPHTLDSAHSLAAGLHHLGQYGEARRMVEDTLERRRRTLGEEHPDTLDSAHSLAGALHDLGQYVQARRMHEDTLERRRRTLGEDHPDTLDSAHSLASSLHNLGQYADAQRMIEDTFVRRRRILGEDHPDTLVSAHDRAASLHALGQYAEARRMVEDALERRRRTLGDDHPHTLSYTHDLAASLHNLGQYAEARRMDEDTLERRRRTLGEDHPHTLASAHSLAVTLHALGQPTDAHRMHEDTLDRRRRTLGEDHPDTLDSAHSLAVALHALGQDADARSMDEDTLDRRRRTLGENHPDTLDSAHSLAASLHNLGQYAEARRMDEYTLDGRRRILGEDHLRTLQSAYSLAVTLSALRDHATAVRLLKDTRARSRRTLGEDHQLTKDVTEALANELTAVGKRHEAQKLLSARKAGARPVTRRKRR